MIGAPALRWAFLGIAVWGAIHPMAYFVAWFRENGLSLSGMAQAWHANAASSGLVWDLTIAAIALTIWVIAESLPVPALGRAAGDPGHLLHRGQLWPAIVSVPAVPARTGRNRRFEGWGILRLC